MALAQRPKVLLLDEPTTYLDIAHQLEVLELVRTLNRELKLTVVMVLHNLNHGSTYSEDVLTQELIRNLYSVETEIEQRQDKHPPRIHVLHKI